jgi:hypothetical protein
MDTLDFKISVTKKNYIVLILLGVFLSVALLTFFEIVFAFVFITVFIIFFIWNLLIYFKTTMQEPKMLSFKENHLVIENEPSIEIDYMKIQKIILRFDIINEKKWLKDIDSLSLTPSTGQESLIEIITKDGEKIKRNVWCEDDANHQRFKSLKFFLQEKGVDVKTKWAL